MTVLQMYESACKTLNEAGDECFRSDVDNIFKHCLGMDKTQLILNKGREISLDDEEKILNIVEKRKKHIPLQYILGVWEFMDLEFKVGDGVLIPRDDTSVLINAGVNFLKEKKTPKIVDLCSGSGCISIALEKSLKNAPEIYGIEISQKAFQYLEENIKNHSSKVTAINEDIFTAHKKFENNSLDAVISNPPYIKTSELNHLQLEVRFEPTIALDGGESGLDFYKKICEFWIPKLKRGGLLAFELGIGQLEDVKQIMLDKNLKSIKKMKDINNIDRVIMGVKV